MAQPPSPSPSPQPQIRRPRRGPAWGYVYRKPGGQCPVYNGTVYHTGKGYYRGGGGGAKLYNDPSRRCDPCRPGRVDRMCGVRGAHCAPGSVPRGLGDSSGRPFWSLWVSPGGHFAPFGGLWESSGDHLGAPELPRMLRRRSLRLRSPRSLSFSQFRVPIFVRGRRQWPQASRIRRPRWVRRGCLVTPTVSLLWCSSYRFTY